VPGLSLGRAYLQDWLDTFDDFKSEPVDLMDAGEDKVIAVTRISGRPKLSGVETDLTYAALYTIRDGKIVRGREYLDATRSPQRVSDTSGNRIRTLSASMRPSRRREVQRPLLPTSTSSSSPTLRFWATGSGSGRFTFTL
jgi:hypothetical protein